MKQKILAAFFCLCCAYLSAQAPVDIFDPFYDDVKIWENTGLINDAPLIRPYPLQEIKRILEIVIERGDEKQIKLAQDYHKRFFYKAYHIGGKTEFTLKAPEKTYEIILSPVLDINYEIGKYLSVSASINAYLTNRQPYESIQPQFRYTKHDLAQDSVLIGKMYCLPVFNSGLAIGTPEYYFTAGIARTDYGPFYGSNIFIGSQAMHQGQFNFVVNKPKWTYEQSFLTLSASDDTGTSTLSPNKFINIHSLSIRPLPWLSLGLVDVIVYGNRFEPIYLIPFSAFFISQGLYNFPDNSLIGCMFTIKPIKGLRLDGAILTDDIGFNEIVKFKKDAKWRLSGQFGISYTMPKTHWFTFADFHYTFVMPYTYTHFDGNTIHVQNKQNYTHARVPLGSNLEPNSDRVLIKFKFRPLDGFDINFSNTFIRHANITESIHDVTDDVQFQILKEYLSNDYTTNGSIFNHATIMNSNGAINHAFLYSTPFMKQKTIQYVNQLELELAYNFPIIKSGGIIQIKAGYIFEANINSGINRNIYKKTSVNINDKNAVKAEQQKQLSEWRKSAKGKEFNHFFNFAIKIVY